MMISLTLAAAAQLWAAMSLWTKLFLTGPATHPLAKPHQWSFKLGLFSLLALGCLLFSAFTEIGITVAEKAIVTALDKESYIKAIFSYKSSN